MKTLLRIDASARKQGSHSRALADHFQHRWLEAYPGGKILTRDLAEYPVPHLENATISAFLTNGSSGHAPVPGAVLSDELIAELKSAAQVLISSPLYNFNLPSTLKAYLDHVVRFGRTFGANESGYFGMLAGKSVCVVTARGGSAADGLDGLDFQGPSLKAVFEFLGFNRVDWIALTGTCNDDAQLETRAAQARFSLDALFDPQPAQPSADNIEWRGLFSLQDRDAINALRAAQVRAILAGDAQSYARHCTDDVLLMLQGRDVVSGRAQFLECETQLFRTTKFEAMQQIPLRVERQGNLAVESGRQELATVTGSAQAESFKARRKYTHVLRKTAAGWRFAVLMSNNSL